MDRDIEPLTIGFINLAVSVLALTVAYAYTLLHSLTDGERQNCRRRGWFPKTERPTASHGHSCLITRSIRRQEDVDDRVDVKASGLSHLNQRSGYTL